MVNYWIYLDNDDNYTSPLKSSICVVKRVTPPKHWVAIGQQSLVAVRCSIPTLLMLCTVTIFLWTQHTFTTHHRQSPILGVLYFTKMLVVIKPRAQYVKICPKYIGFKFEKNVVFNFLKLFVFKQRKCNKTVSCWDFPSQSQ